MEANQGQHQPNNEGGQGADDSPEDHRLGEVGNDLRLTVRHLT